MLGKNEEYNPNLYIKEENPPVSRRITPEQALMMVSQMGYVITGTVLLPI